MMKFFAVFCLLALAVSAQDNEVKFVIDPFTTISDTIVILIPSGGVVDPIVENNFATSSTIMGGERDLQLTVTSGDGNLVLTTGVSGGVYTSATPNEARGNSLLQLDGADGTLDINTSGLFSDPDNNFMNEDAFAFRVLIESDLPGTLVFRVYSGGAANQFCSTVVNTPGDDTLNEYILPFSQFTGTCDFSNVGALEIVVGMDDNIDVLLSDWSTYGPVVTCQCFCPEFTCFLQVDNDGTFTYYLTSQFGVIQNPTTDLSSQYIQTGTFNPTTDLSTVFTTITSLFSTDLFSSFSTFFTSFDFTSFTSGFSSFTSFDFSTSSSSSSSNSGSSSSSDASVLSVSILLVTLVAAMF